MICNQYQNYNFADLGINMSNQIKEEIKRKGLTATFPTKTAIPVVNIPRRSPQKEHDLSPNELLSLFDRREALTFVYIPHLMTYCIIFFIDALCQYLSENRISQYRWLSRKLSDIKSDYYGSLRREMPYAIYQKFLSLRDEYLDDCMSTLLIMGFTFKNEMCGHCAIEEDSMVASYCYIIVCLVQYINDFDLECNRKIAKKLNTVVRNNGDSRMPRAKRICESVVKPYMCIGQTRDMKMSIAILVNKAKEIINNMIK